MPGRLSRRKIAQYAAERLVDGGADIVKQVAAMLVAEGRQRELDLIVRDIYDALESKGVVVATVSSAHGLSDQLKQAVQKMVGADRVIIREQINKDLIGGVKIETANKRYDGTVKYKLSELRAQKI
jgi:F-type H+-transporting ATPase subunit delta